MDAIEGGMALDNFREWISDNLRYILLGVGILAAAVLIFMGVRTFTGPGKEKGKTESGNKVETESENQTEGEDKQTAENSLEKDSVPEVTKLIEDYYEALGNKDVSELKKLVDNLDPAEETKIANTKYIESYEDVEVYTTKGLEDGTYVVFASFAYKCADVDTPAPALSQLYVITDEEGGLKISADAVNDSEIQDYVNTVMDEAAVVQLRNNVQAAYDQAQASDPDLKAFLESLGGADAGTPTPTPVSENAVDGQQNTGTAGEGMMTALDDCNVRIAAQSGSQIVTVVPAGEAVTRLGEENGWVQIEYGGVVGYVYQDLLR